MRFDPETERLVVTVFFNNGQSSTYEDVRHFDRPSHSLGDYRIYQPDRETLIPTFSVLRVDVRKEPRP